MRGLEPIRAVQAGAVALAGAALLSPLPASAGQATNEMAVSVVIPEGCQVTTRPLSFGTVTILSAAVDATSTITLQCAPGTAYSVALDGGLHASGSQRRMYAGPGGFAALRYVNYHLYRNAARTLSWGSTAGQTVGGVAPANGAIDLIVYGRMPGAIVLPTAYHDTVTVTVSF